MVHIHDKIDFVVDALICHNKKILLIDHIKMKRWLPIGGHIELDEDPEEALFREIKEECGIDKSQLTILSTKLKAKSKDTKFLLTPNFLDVHVISKKHKHIGLIYLIKSKTDKVTLAPNEHNEIRWFSLKDLDNKKYRLSTAIKSYCKTALKQTSKK